MDANQAKADVNIKTYMQETKANMEKITAKIEDNLKEEINLAERK
jgi:hypothetical protein